MKAADHAHVVHPEEIMAYMDGELPPDRALAVRAHVTTCDVCQAVAADLMDVSRDLTRWHIEGPTAEVGAPAGPIVIGRRRLTSIFGLLGSASRQLAAAAAIVIVVGLVWSAIGFRGMKRSEAVPVLASTPGPLGNAGGAGGAGGRLPRDKPETAWQESAPGAGAQGQQGRSLAASATEPKIIRTVHLSVVAAEFDGVKPTIERILREVSGFVGQIQASDPRISERSVQATLRIPASRLDEALAALRGLGHVLEETQSGEDVTEQVMDVAARLTNARNTEKRLNDVLATRTGNVASVLEVEREIARVRAEIERLDAQRANLDSRVAYSTVTLRVTEQRRASLEAGPFPLTGRLRNAFIDGLREAADSVIAAVLWLLGAGPVLLFWTGVLWLIVRVALRRLRPAPRIP
jgi:uncharacterized small protein (DUF1192 family)